jgi:hypothetical protein
VDAKWFFRDLGFGEKPNLQRGENLSGHRFPIALGLLAKETHSGYQGESPRPMSQRQSGANCTRVHTGLPSVPAKCVTVVSTLMSRSMQEGAAAVSAKSVKRGERSWTR